MVIAIKKRTIIIIILLIISSILCAMLIPIISTFANSRDPNPNITVVIDAGHGGVDVGAMGVSTGVKESDLNLAVAKKLKAIFEFNRIDVVMTREDENGLYGSATFNRKNKDMRKRKEIIRNANPDAIISIHMNIFSQSKQRGAQIFYAKGSKEGIKFANIVQEILEANIKYCNRSILPGDYYILKCSAKPTILIECGFLSNTGDERLLMTDEYQEKLATNIVRASLLYIGAIPMVSESIKIAHFLK